MRLERVAVVGAGAWGTALAQAAALAGREVTLFGRDAAVVAEVNDQHCNSRYLAGQTLSERVRASTGRDVGDADFVVLAVPAQASRACLTDLEGVSGRPVVLTAKGLEEGTLLRQSEILAEVLPEATPFVLSGPSFAADVAAGRPTAVTLAGEDASDTSDLCLALAGPSLRLYASDDRIGVELAGALKNIYAVACGAVEGADLGASARAALMARGFAELGRLVAALGGSATTLTGLSGLGDLTLSCMSGQSRNYRFGRALGAGLSLTDIAARSPDMLAEGVRTAPVAQQMARRAGVDVPLIDAVNLLLAGNARIDQIVAGLMSRPLKREES